MQNTQSALTGGTLHQSNVNIWDNSTASLRTTVCNPVWKKPQHIIYRWFCTIEVKYVHIVPYRISESMSKENFCPGENFCSAAHRNLTMTDCCAGIHWSPPPGLALMGMSVGLSEAVLGVCPFGQTGYSCTRLTQTELHRAMIHTLLYQLKNWNSDVLEFKRSRSALWVWLWMSWLWHVILPSCCFGSLWRLYLMGSASCLELELERLET